MLSAKKTKRENNINLKNRLERTQADLNALADYLQDFSSFLPLPVCVINPVGLVVNVNRAFEQISEFKLTEIIGTPFKNIFANPAKAKKLLILTVKTGKIGQQEMDLLTKSKKSVAVSLSLSARKDGQGRLEGYFASITDISDLKKFQKETEKQVQERTRDLEESRRALLNILEDTEAAKVQVEEEKSKTQAVLDNFIDGLLIFEQDKRLKFINSTAEEFLGIKHSQLIGRSMSELEKEPHIEKLMMVIKKESGKVFRKEITLENKKQVLEITTRPISYGKKSVFLVVLHDITREKVIEKLKSQFVSVAAHQLRTPLSIVKWSLSMLLEGEMGPLNEEQQDMLQKTNQSNERMIRLINDLLNVARIEEGRFVYRPKTVDFPEVVQAVLESARALAQKKKINLKFKTIESKKPKIVKADIEKLSLAIKNLVDNAIQYTHSGGTVSVIVQRKGGKIEFSVQDSGIGIPKDQQKRVFTKFFRGDNAVRTQTEGTGLGLFITKNIIEAHKGKIWFESTEGKGTTFRFSLPAIG